LPELPAIAHLKRSLEPKLVGAAVRGLELRRPEIVRNAACRTLCVHLGMSGQLWFCPAHRRLGRYADEILFAARIHPLSVSRCIPPARQRVLAASIRRILDRALGAGGSTICDYVDADRRVGTYRQRHRVYGRRLQPCLPLSCDS
jgi:formamidopyrimidine-DNA glycosylase